jgi:hypothetical protein
MWCDAPFNGALPEAASEYSTVRKAIFGLIAASAAVLALAQFLPLFHAHVPTLRAAVASSSVGADHSYGVLALAALALVLGWGVYAARSRFALALTGLLGVAGLAIALGNDLSDARAQGLRLVGGHYLTATNAVAFGLYVEIAGALGLLLGAGLGFLFGEPPVGAAGVGASGSDQPPRGSGRGGPAAPRRRARSEVIRRRERPEN